MYLELCSKEQLREFYAEFGATEESVKRDVQYLIEWMSKQAHLPNITDEEWLSNFLLRGKNSIERTKMLLDRYYTAKALMPELFTYRNLYSDEVSHLTSYCGMCPMPKLTPEGYRVIILDIFEKRTDDIPNAEFQLKIMQMILDLCLKIDKVRGVTLVYNTENMTLAYVSPILLALKKFIAVQNKISPLRYDKIYILNASPILQPLINFGSLIVKKQLEKLVVWKKRTEDLVEVIPEQCLPKEYGGTLPPMRILKDSFHELCKEYQDWINDEEKYKADLSLKPSDCRSSAEFEMLDGSFRKLCVD